MCPLTDFLLQPAKSGLCLLLSPYPPLSRRAFRLIQLMFTHAHKERPRLLSWFKEWGGGEGHTNWNYIWLGHKIANLRIGDIHLCIWPLVSILKWLTCVLDCRASLLTVSKIKLQRSKQPHSYLLNTKRTAIICWRETDKERKRQLKNWTSRWRSQSDSPKKSRHGHIWHLCSGKQPLNGSTTPTTSMWNLLAYHLNLLSQLEDLQNNYLHCSNAPLFSRRPSSLRFPPTKHFKHSFPCSFQLGPGRKHLSWLWAAVFFFFFLPLSFFHWAPIALPLTPWYFIQFTSNYILTFNLIGCEDGCMVMRKGGQVESSQFLCRLGANFFSHITFKVKGTPPMTK